MRLANEDHTTKLFIICLLSFRNILTIIGFSLLYLLCIVIVSIPLFLTVDNIYIIIDI